MVSSGYEQLGSEFGVQALVVRGHAKSMVCVSVAQAVAALAVYPFSPALAGGDVRIEAAVYPCLVDDCRTTLGIVVYITPASVAPPGIALD